MLALSVFLKNFDNVSERKMNKKNSTNNFSTILSSIIILLIVVGALGFLFIRTENFSTTLKNFYVTCGDDNFFADRDNFDIIVGQEYKFEINSTINVSGNEKKYYVSVLPNETSTTAFEFNVGENTRKYADLESLTKGFQIVAYEDYFVLTANLDLHDILSLYFPSETLTNVPTAVDSDLPYFKLVIQNADKSETININFNLKKYIYTLTIYPINDSSNVDAKNALTFSSNKIVLTNDIRTASFDYTIKSGYEYEFGKIEFEADGFSLERFDNICTITLSEDLTSDKVCEIKFYLKSSKPTMTITPVKSDADSCPDDVISFSTNKIVLTNDSRSASFTFYIQDGYELYNLIYSANGYVAVVDGNTCTVTLTEDLTATENRETLTFDIAYMGNSSATLMVLVEDSANSGNISFSPDHIILSNSDREESFVFTLKDGYDYTLDYEENDLFEVVLDGDTYKVALKDGCVLEQSYTYILSFCVFEN